MLWFAIRLMIACAIVLRWQLHQVDFVMAYTQAPIEHDMYMRLPTATEVKGGTVNCSRMFMVEGRLETVGKIAWLRS